MKIEGVEAGLQSLPELKPEEKDKGFGNVLNKTINDLNDIQQKSKDLSTQLALNKDVELHDVMIAVQEADVAMRLTVQLRNKMLEAYREVMRMTV